MEILNLDEVVKAPRGIVLGGCQYQIDGEFTLEQLLTIASVGKKVQDGNMDKLDNMIETIHRAVFNNMLPLKEFKSLMTLKKFTALMNFLNSEAEKDQVVSKKNS